MSHFYLGQQQIRSSRATREEFSYQRNLLQFDLNNRAVKLPPIIKNELLVGRGGQTTMPPSSCSTMSKAGLNSSFPKIIDAQPPTSGKNGTTPSRHKAVQSKRAAVKHVEPTPIHFPNSYTVLPPIGQTNAWRHYNGLSSLQAPRNGEQAPIPDQIKSGQRRSSPRKRSDNSLTPSPTTRVVEKKRIETRNSSQPARHEGTTAVENRRKQQQASLVLDSTPGRSEVINDETLPSLSNEDVQVTEYDSAVHVLERLELDKEAVEFLAGKHSRRRVATCIEIDPSLRKAVDVIRDNLLRQTMEELCMMW